MKFRMQTLAMAAVLSAAIVRGETDKRDPRIGYLYPAGGQQGTTVQIMIGGQYLSGADAVYVSGTGVTASVNEHYRPIRNLNQDQRELLRTTLEDLRDKRLSELLPADSVPLVRMREELHARRKREQANAAQKPPRESSTNAPAAAAAGNKKRAADGPVTLPDHPLLKNLESKSLRELMHITDVFFNPNQRQFNQQMAEMMVVELAIAPTAPPGDRELRIGTLRGLTNPMRVQIGVLPETCEQEPNDDKLGDQRLLAVLPPEPPLDLPIVINGQISITAGDIDRFKFRAKKGEQLVIDVDARHLIPYLADTVPGWFQATVAVYDAHGKELAFTDDYRFSPDPVLFFKVPETGIYELEIRDALYRGRDDFVYRVSVGVQPFITRMFPLGGRTGETTVASISGWNLSAATVHFDTRPGGSALRQAALRGTKRLSNCVPYAVNTLPETNETEPNDAIQHAQQITLPKIINGRIAKAGDVDVFAFEGRAGDAVVAEVYGRRLDSPIDSVLRLTDASGCVLAQNDDHEDKEMGMYTHHADSYLRARLPTNGTFFVQVADTQGHGGEAYGYRLRLSAPLPDFALRVTPSGINVPATRAMPITVHVVRKDGFTGAVEVVLHNAPDGFELYGARIPAGRDSIRMTLHADRAPAVQPVAFELEGRAVIEGETVCRPIIPADDLMQAFAYRHLAPSQQLLAFVAGGGRGAPPIRISEQGPVRIPFGGTTNVLIHAPRRPLLQDLQFELSDPPNGVTLREVKRVPGGLSLVMHADATNTLAGFADNLIVEAYMEQSDTASDGKAAQKRRIYLGVLPAIPYEVVRQ